MAKAIQRRRGTTAQHASFTGLAGEITVDTDKNTAVVHDNSTAGGFPLQRAPKTTATISSATTTDLGSSPESAITISGTTTITGLGSSAPNGAVKFVEFSGALTLTHNGTSLIIPGAANIITAAGDCATVRHEGSGNWRVLHYTRAIVGPNIETHGIALSDETTAITTGTNKATFSLPYAFYVTAVYATLNTVSSSGIPTVDINEAGTTIMSTNKLTIDASEKTSATAATAAGITDPSIAANAEIGFDIDVAGTGAKGLKVFIQGYRI